MQHHTGADIWIDPACRCKPSGLRGLREIGARPGSHGRAVHEVHGMDVPANLPGVVKNRQIGGQKSGNSNAGKALFNDVNGKG